MIQKCNLSDIIDIFNKFNNNNNLNECIKKYNISKDTLVLLDINRLINNHNNIINLYKTNLDTYKIKALIDIFCKIEIKLLINNITKDNITKDNIDYSEYIELMKNTTIELFESCKKSKIK